MEGEIAVVWRGALGECHEGSRILPLHNSGDSGRREFLLAFDHALSFLHGFAFAGGELCGGEYECGPEFTIGAVHFGRGCFVGAGG